MTKQAQQEHLQRLMRQINKTTPGSSEEADLLKRIKALEAQIKGNVGQTSPVNVQPDEKLRKASSSKENVRYDIFLSHYNEDKAQVEQIALWLKEHHIRPWFDKWDLIPGIPWQEAMEKGLRESICVSAFLGPSGSFGNWGNMEMRTAVRLGVKQKKPIFMVMLPGCADDPEIPLFLEEFTWVDLRKGFQDQENLERLKTAILYHREP